MGLTVTYRKSEPPEVRIQTLEGEAQAHMLDISEGGLSIVTERSIPAATVLWVRFTLTRPEKKGIGYYGVVEVMGEVRHSVVNEQGQYRLGIAFVKIDEECKRQIASFIGMLEDPGAP